ncbi:transposase [Salegentibacter sp. 24]|uniref:IS1634 family transposase n=1 Tax=Salegentibacter sp. 24 TaxID=2183986 RepID=UPI00105EC490|nr:IS1634 family transposase [Salegentibacter sp. 24]TDN78109.1 transposase [Salegentibacter sp. 24]
MFVRKKPNKSGLISIQIIDKSSGKYVVRETVGSSDDPQEIEHLVKKGKQRIVKLAGQVSMSFDRDKELEFVDAFMNSLDTFYLVGPELLLGKLFDEIGFNTIEEELFRHLVITRLIYPVSKLRTVDYLFKYKGVEISVYSVYRYLDKLHKEQMEQIKQISLKHTLSLYDNALSVVFYDVTTLYFEASKEDELRITGFSKDGKHQNPQIVLGLLVSDGGYPIDYHIFEGNKYEGDTLLPVVDHFSTKYQSQHLTIVADSGLLSKRNIELLTQKNYKYILGARIKNEPDSIKKQILGLDLKDKEYAEVTKEQQRLIINFKEQRAHKDAHNRKRGLERLEKRLKSGKLNKTHINNKGFNKYLKIEGKVDILIDYQKFEDDAKWDGLKGFATNTDLPSKQVIDQYRELWTIEKTFRIAKSDLKIRPIYHRLRRRIEAHICVSFAACKVYKELERQLKTKESSLSPEKAIDILKTIYQVSIQSPYSSAKHNRLVLKNEEQKDLVNLFDLDRNLS